MVITMRGLNCWMEFKVFNVMENILSSNPACMIMTKVEVKDLSKEKKLCDKDAF